MPFPITKRQNYAAEHEQLDPIADNATIFEQLFTREFPIEFLLAAEVAQIRTFMFPSGSKLLHRTGEFEKNSLKRLDDTRGILVEMGRDGFDSPRAKTMAEHLNKIHGFYNIPNEEFLYTLSTFVFDVCDFINVYGWRKLTRTEELAIYYTYCEMGRLMHIQNIPDTFEGFRAWRDAYAAEHKGYDLANEKVTNGIFKGLRQSVPWFIRPFIVSFSFSLAEPELPDYLGYRRPRPFVRGFYQALMGIRKRFNRYFTLWDVWSFEEMVTSNFKSYPKGYNPLSLGPTKLIRAMRKQQATKEFT